MEKDVVKRIVFIVYSKTGLKLAQKATACFPDAEIKICTVPRLLKGNSGMETPIYLLSETGEYSIGALFEWADAMIFIGALGIAVRKIAPFVKDKRYDPAVLCMDELGKYVIPVLSGHIGGANKLAIEVAEKLGSIPVVTTATDINGRFSADTWARQNGLIISDMKMAKAISAAILEQDIFLESDFPVVTDYPPGCRLSEGDKTGNDSVGILISWEQRNPFDKTLWLIPPVIHIGIGCRKGIPKETISEAVENALTICQVDMCAVKGVYSIDLKASEEGLIQYCEEKGWPFHVYTAQELMQVPGDFSASDFVRQITGADNICERAAMAGADRLILKKTSHDGVTVALAAEQFKVRF